MITFTEKISHIEVVNGGELNNVVKKCRYTISGELNNKTATSFKEVVLDDPVANDFVNFDELTEALVLSWVHNKIGQDDVTALKEGLEAIFSSEAPVAKPLTPAPAPWNK
jgi:hypothetical protein